MNPLQNRYQNHCHLSRLVFFSLMFQIPVWVFPSEKEKNGVRTNFNRNKKLHWRIHVLRYIFTSVFCNIIFKQRTEQNVMKIPGMSSQVISELKRDLSTLLSLRSSPVAPAVISTMTSILWSRISQLSNMPSKENKHISKTH